MVRGTVLVVDPDDFAQSIVASILGEAGFGVIRTYDMLSAVCVMQALDPDLPLILVTGGRGLPWLIGQARRLLPPLV